MARARYLSSGHLVYSVAGTLRLVPFDLDRLRTTGDPVSILEGLEWAGLRVDAEANARTTERVEGRISAAGSALDAWVIPTDEELLIARDTARLVQGAEMRY